MRSLCPTCGVGSSLVWSGIPLLSGLGRLVGLSGGQLFRQVGFVSCRSCVSFGAALPDLTCWDFADLAPVGALCQPARAFNDC